MQCLRVNDLADSSSRNRRGRISAGASFMNSSLTSELKSISTHVSEFFELIPTGPCSSGISIYQWTSSLLPEEREAVADHLLSDSSL
jgi:hypothetical protein